MTSNSAHSSRPDIAAAQAQAVRQLQQVQAGSSGPVKALVAVSGGVDSAVSALLVRQAGLQAQAVFMKNWDEDDGTDQCRAQEDYDSAREACDLLDMPLRQVSFAPEYWQQVFEPMLDGYRRGDTPNPDILCNRHIKFGILRQYAQAAGFTHLATGHYCRLTAPGAQEPVRLLRGADRNKDQSYFLQGVTAPALRNTLFPIGDLQREQVREIARQAGLANWNRPGSTGICFVGERHFGRFLGNYLPAGPGDIVSARGEVIGRHCGAALYTVGQRKGLGIGGQAGARQAPWYVAQVDVQNNRLTAVQEGDRALYSRQLSLDAVNWIGAAPELPARLTARIRYRQTDRPCLLSQTSTGYTVLFDHPQWAAATGQYCALYRSAQCLGGGAISSVHSEQTDG